MNEEKVTVFVNGKEKDLFRGLRVRHAIDARWTKAIQKKRAVLRDGDGNHVDIDGALHDGQRLHVIKLLQTRTGYRA